MIVFLHFLLFNFAHPSMATLPKKDQIAYGIIQNFAKKISSKDLYVRGIGLRGDKKTHKLASLGISLKIDKIMTVDIARRLAIEYTNDFVLFINQNPQIVTYITTFPVTVNEVDIMIRGKERCDDDPNYVACVATDMGAIIYFNDVKPPNALLFEENFEEAQAKLQGNL